MFSKDLLNGIRRMKIYRDNHSTPVFTSNSLRVVKPSFFIEWDKKSGQFKIVPQETCEKVV
ncbi:hypothetical protein KAU33_04260 [Candidatus Dependentiae bacterium]|nr:hypothetical protein [Candidatus Dependentiae bacterium]